MNINALMITTSTSSITTSSRSREGSIDGKLNRVHFLLPAYQATAKHADDSDGAAEFINAEEGDAVWVPPEAADNDDDDDTNHLGAHTNDDDDADGDDDEWHDGISWGQPSSSDSEPSPSPSPSPREERHTGMLRAMDRQLKMLTTRFLASAGISLPGEDDGDDGGEGWLIKPDGKAGNEMDPGSYIKVKRVASGTRRQW